MVASFKNIPKRFYARFGPSETLVKSPSSGSPPPGPIGIRIHGDLGADEPSAALVKAMTTLIAEVNAERGASQAVQPNVERDAQQAVQPAKKVSSRKVTISLAGLALGAEEIAALEDRMLQRLRTLGLEGNNYQIEFAHLPGDEK